MYSQHYEPSTTQILVAVLVITILSGSAGCTPKAATSDSAGPVTVSIAQPVERQVTDFAEFTGRLEAVNSVDIKSRVTGYLLKTDFREGSQVKAGQVLCQIDPRKYQAEYDAANGALSASEAKLALAKTENERAKNLFQENPHAISQKSLDQHQAEEDSAAADVVAAKSNTEVYKLNLEFSKNYVTD